MSTAPNPTPTRQYRSRSFFGPVVLITIGVIFLLRNAGYISTRTVIWWFGRYWPALLILWGVVKVAEYLWARRTGEPAPRGIGPGGVVALIFLIMIGMTTTGVSRIDWDQFRNNTGMDPETDFWLWQNHYDFTENLSQSVAEATQIKVLNGSGDITVSPSPDGQAHLYVHKSLRSDSQDAANKLNESTHPQFTQQGRVWVLDLTSGNFEHGRFNLDLQLPPDVPLALNTRHGDISVNQRGAAVEMSTDRGSLTAKDVKGNATLNMHHGDANVNGVTGNVEINGSGGDITVSDVGGTLAVNGEYNGDNHYNKVAGQVRFKSNRTDLQLAKLDGDFTMDRGDLRADNLAGPFKLDTRSKAVHLENVTGDVRVDDTNAGVEVTTKTPLGNIEISNTRGGIEVALPANAGFQIDAESKNGDIQSDFPLDVDNKRRDAVARGTVGKGGPVVRLRAERGTIQIKRE
jgi:DUF4097 and DUF4098 domain-containing protein YvlB